MVLSPEDIGNLMTHYIMTKDRDTGIFGHDTRNLVKLGLLAPRDKGEINWPLSDKGLVLAQLIIDNANEACA